MRERQGSRPSGFKGGLEPTAPAPSPSRREPKRLAAGAGDASVCLSLARRRRCWRSSPGGARTHGALGVLRLTVELSAIESLSGEKPAPVITAPEGADPRCPPAIAAPGRRCAPSATPLNVRGLRVHEAEAAVEETLRGARGPVWVIHGIAPATLKRGLRPMAGHPLPLGSSWVSDR